MQSLEPLRSECAYLEMFPIPQMTFCHGFSYNLWLLIWTLTLPSERSPAIKTNKQRCDIKPRVLSEDKHGFRTMFSALVTYFITETNLSFQFHQLKYGRQIEDRFGISKYTGFQSSAFLSLLQPVGEAWGLPICEWCTDETHRLGQRASHVKGKSQLTEITFWPD